MSIPVRPTPQRIVGAVDPNHILFPLPPFSHDPCDLGLYPKVGHVGQICIVKLVGIDGMASRDDDMLLPDDFSNTLLDPEICVVSIHRPTRD
jgi:hypothetical protein